MRMLLLAVALCLAGCAGTGAVPEAEAAEPDDGQATTGHKNATTGPPTADGPSAQPAGPPGNDPPALNLTLGAIPPTTRNATLHLSGTSNLPSTLTIRADGANATVPEPFQVNGSWNASLPLPIGRTKYNVTATNEHHSTSRSFAVVRLAQATLQVTYRADVGMDDRDSLFWFDIDAMASAATGAYDGCSQPHPGFPTVHDAMIAWTQSTGHEVTYSECGDYGVSVEAIEGHASPGFWCYTINGQAASQGISTQRMKPDDTIAWDDCTLVFG